MKSRHISAADPLRKLASLATLSVCRNCIIHEWEDADDELFREMTGGAYPTQKNGCVTLLDSPGIGIKVDFAEFKRRHPYKAIRGRAQVKV